MQTAIQILQSKATNCSRCGQPIANCDFVCFRQFGSPEPKFFHNRHWTGGDCWGNYLLEHVQKTHIH